MCDLNFDFLQGQALGLLCFGPYSLTFRFDGGTMIQVESEFRHATFEDSESTKKYRFPISTSHLTRLLMQKVTSVEVKENGKLTLGFSNGDILVIQGRIGPYEAYQLAHDGKFFVV